MSESLEGENNGGRSDFVEIQEVIVEFLSKYDALYEKRIQKLVFYGEIYTAQNYGMRLTDADFMPYHYGPYSRLLSNGLEELKEDPRVGETREGQYFCRTGTDGGTLSDQKKRLIAEVHRETKTMSTDELVDFAKDTWLWQAFEEEEDIDFAQYIDEITHSDREIEQLRHTGEKQPVEKDPSEIFG